MTPRQDIGMNSWQFERLIMRQELEEAERALREGRRPRPLSYYDRGNPCLVFLFFLLASGSFIGGAFLLVKSKVRREHPYRADTYYINADYIAGGVLLLVLCIGLLCGAYLASKGECECTRPERPATGGTTVNVLPAPPERTLGGPRFGAR